ncbi:glutathionylspermidine synthase family protein [Shewanella glacialipiscicola]|uniref:glutathionylspermidine synthase family protein n=1 Tax=Shewanella glacialipiscicola TaxID=614069 RepID=UPI003D7A64E2
MLNKLPPSKRIFTDSDISAKLIKDLAPITSESMSLSAKTLESCDEQFTYLTECQSKMPVALLSESQAKQITLGAGMLYDAMVQSLKFLFNEYIGLVPYFYGKEFIRGNPDFVEYAIDTYKKSNPAIYGRFDIAYDFERSKFNGVLEFNGDTPVMLFESVYLPKNATAESMCGLLARPYDNYLDNLQKMLAESCMGKRCAVLCDLVYIEDSLTTETLYKAFSDAGCDVVFADIGQLEYNAGDSPTFTVYGAEVERIFILSPWEEMVLNGPEVFADWKKWNGRVQFFEPAWRWFISNKGSLAWLHFFIRECENPLAASEMRQFYSRFKEYISLIPFTSMSKIDFDGRAHVSKPIYGRLSNNITFYDESGNVTDSTGGHYDDSPLVYQDKVTLCSIENEAYTMVNVWMTPSQGQGLFMKSGCIALRECDTAITSIRNERFLNHGVVSDKQLKKLWS